MRSALLLSLVIASASFSALCAEDDAEEAVSYFAGLSANWAGLRKYDVLVENYKFSSSGDGKTTEVEGKFRLIADHDIDRYLFIYSGFQEEGTGSNTVKARGLTAFYFDRASEQVWKFDLLSGKPIKLAVKASDSHFVEKTLSASGFPEVRLIGSYEYPHPAFNGYTIDEAFETDFNTGRAISLQALGDKSVRITVDREYGQEVRFRRIYVFDVEKLVPSSLTYIYSGADGSHPKVTRKEGYKWEEVDEVFVPKSVTVENLQSTERANGAVSQVTTDVSFKWLSVNEEIDPEVLRLDVIRSSKKMLELAEGKGPNETKTEK